MATQKPDLTRVWANNAPTGNVVDPDTTSPGKVATGWQAEVPPFEHFNFLQKWFTQGLAHFNEQGIGVWDTDTTYPINGLAKGSDGNIYKAIVEQSDNDPVSDGGTNWVPLISANSVFLENIQDIQNVYRFENNSFIIKDFFTGSSDGKGGIWTYDSTVAKADHNGVDTISPTVPWDGLPGQTHEDFKNKVGETDPSGNGCLIRYYNKGNRSNATLDPVFVEQFITGFHGRGMLTAETDNIATEQAIIGNFSAGSDIVGVTNTGDFRVGGTITILHDNGLYWTYFISAIGQSLAIKPALRWDVSSSSRCERTWYNAAHPGKFYMRQLGQRISRSPEYELSLAGTGRILFSQYDSDPNVTNDILTPIGSASVSYLAASNIGESADNLSVPRSLIGRTAFITITASGDGAKTYDAALNGATSVLVRFVAYSSNTSAEVFVRVKDDQGRVSAEIKIDAGSGSDAPKIYTAVAQLAGDAETVHLEFLADSSPTTFDIIVDQVEIFEGTRSLDPVISVGDKAPIILGLGDSWITGDLVSTVEREPIMYQIATEFPFAKVINKGIGGNKVQDLIARFDTDVRPENPDYVIVNVGTNDAYNPASGTFFPNSVDFFVSKLTELISLIQGIGAKPIIIGLPGLKEADITFTNWELNDRARLYAQYFYKRVSRDIPVKNLLGTCTHSGGIPTGSILERGSNVNGEYIKFADGTLICIANVDLDTSAGGNGISIPAPFSFDITDITPVSSLDLKTISTANTITAMADAFVVMTGASSWAVYFPTAGTATETFGLMAIGRWY